MPGTARLSWVDIALIVLFLIGIYTNYTIPISKNVPIPSIPAGVAGLILLWRRRDQISRAGLMAFILVIALYTVSILCAPDLNFLPRRTNGLIQLVYSMTIGYALFLTVTLGSRNQIAGLFLGCALTLAIGCLLETYGGLRPISDSVRSVLYSRGFYDGDLRDLTYYDRVRPKFFASEPSSVTFCYSLFTFLWLVASSSRWKLILYGLLFALGIAAMPGPTLLLMLILAAPYLVFLASRSGGKVNFARLIPNAAACLLCAGAVLLVAQTVFVERNRDAQSGNDPSAFYRVRGPALAGIDIMSSMPFGAGLTGEPFIQDRVTNLYLRSPAYSSAWPVVHPASELLINYFWLHWIYLGLVPGLILIAAISYWLTTLGVPSPAFCWVVWAILGQASGAYVGPTCWGVLFLAAAVAVLNQRTTSKTWLLKAVD
ncbi:hypothetical protein [Reyranella sp.]|uniref:hypothetical protein n=1 Tax=Reyranella sp. TaxID=1929291 RepID=UPI001201005A|nr:hypothetical protein [Reyranella sp.]TAJ90347.1 MAG: hypothetical protein EPO50_00995 [Reyranella sp.]